MGLLDSELLKMEGVVWRHPTAHKAWVEAEKKKAEEKKKLVAAKKLEAAVDKEREKMIRKQLKETGRLNDMVEAEKRLKTLHKEVAALELKAKGLSKEQIADFELRQSAVKEAENRLKVAGVEAELTGAAALLKKEEVMTKKQKEMSGAQSMIAAQRRRELLEYKHRFGFPASPSPFDLHRARNGGEAPLYPRPSHSNTAIYDDPRFWALSEEDQQLLEGMEWWEQQRLGFGLYGESGEDGLGEEWTGHEVDEEGRRIGEPKYDPLKMRDTFHCLTTETAPGLQILRTLGPVDASVPTVAPPSNAQLTTEERLALREELKLDRAFATSDLIEKAIANRANCLLCFKVNLVPLAEGHAKWYAQGTAAIVRHPSQTQQGWSGLGGNWGAAGGLGTGWGGAGASLGAFDDLAHLEALETGGHGLTGGFQHPLSAMGAPIPGGWPSAVSGQQGLQHPIGSAPFLAYQRMLAKERARRDAALGFGGRGFGVSGQQQPYHPQSYPQQQQSASWEQPQSAHAHPLHQQHASATLPGAFSTRSSHKEDRSLGGNVFSSHSPAPSAIHQATSPRQAGIGTQHLPDASAQQELDKLEKELESIQKRQAAEAGGAGSAAPQQKEAAAGTAAGSWWPKLW